MHSKKALSFLVACYFFSLSPTVANICEELNKLVDTDTVKAVSLKFGWHASRYANSYDKTLELVQSLPAPAVDEYPDNTIELIHNAALDSLEAYIEEVEPFKHLLFFLTPDCQLLGYASDTITELDRILLKKELEGEREEDDEEESGEEIPQVAKDTWTFTFANHINQDLVSEASASADGALRRILRYALPYSFEYELDITEEKLRIDLSRFRYVEPIEEE